VTVIYTQVLFNLPILLDIIHDADNEAYEENLLIVTDAYHSLTAIAGYEKGRAAFISNRGVHVLCDIVTRQTFQHEESLALLLGILSTGQRRLFASKPLCACMHAFCGFHGDVNLSPGANHTNFKLTTTTPGALLLVAL
jgi:hypothetical protein